MTNKTKLHLRQYAGDWVEGASTAFEHFEEIAARLKDEKALAKIYPNDAQVFRALKECPFEKCRVVILGVDPYADGSANGLAYDNDNTRQPLNPSLLRILHKLKEDTGADLFVPTTSYLSVLPPKGVLLLNLALTVRASEPGSHLLYWRLFTKALLESIPEATIIALGGKTQRFCEQLGSSHSIIRGASPSPMSGHLFTTNDIFSCVKPLLTLR
jgi:uracil-DNA glycosylase